MLAPVSEIHILQIHLIYPNYVEQFYYSNHFRYLFFMLDIGLKVPFRKIVLQWTSDTWSLGITNIQFLLWSFCEELFVVLILV